MATSALHLSVSLKKLLIEQFSTDTLLALGCTERGRITGPIARKRLSEAKLEELAEMLTHSKIPTIGWWRRAT